MSEPTNTEVQGNVTGSVQSGSFQGPVQNVNLNIPEPPETIKQQIKDMWVMLFADQIQRRDRQQTVDRWLLGLTIIQVISAVAIWSIIWYLVDTFGWLR